MMRSLFFLIFSMFILACETKVYDQEGSFDASVLNNNNTQNKLNFNGVSDVTNVTDNSATISWQASTGAREYHIFILENDNANFFARVPANVNSFTLKGLESDQDYLIQVRALDEKGLLDNNVQTVSIKTLDKPTDALTLKRVFPDKVNDIFLRPIIEVSGLKVGERVTLYSDNCFTKVGETIAQSDTIQMESIDLVPDFSYQFHVRRKSENGFVSDCSQTFISYNLSSCPDGYALVPEGGNRGVNEFCVMEYEAKAWNDVDEDNFVDSGEVDLDGCNETSCFTPNWGLSTYKPGSFPEGRPWRMLDIENARNECRSLGPNYDLISNREWMVIAEDIEKTATNWTSGIVGTGCLHRGNNGLADGCGYNISEIDQGVPASRALIDVNETASFDLSNGREIWDFSGNVSEWVTWGNERDLEVNNFMCIDEWSEIDLNFCGGVINAIEFMPKNPANISSALYNSSLGLGQLEGGSGNVLARGGSYQYADFAGVFTGSFAHSKQTTKQDIGFRCVFRRMNL